MFHKKSNAHCFPPVPPEVPVILSGRGKVVTGHDMGPFEVGADLEVTCQVAGGKSKHSLINNISINNVI